MPSQKRDLLAILKRELGFLEAGGYAIDRKSPWRPPFIFEDSTTCLNSNQSKPRVPCAECALFELVPEKQRFQKRPCWSIPLTNDGETVRDYYVSGTQKELEWNLMVWLRKTIAKIDRERLKLVNLKLAKPIIDHACLLPRLIRKNQNKH